MWGHSRKKTDDFQIIQMEQWLLWDSFNATQAPPPSLTPSPSLPICSETACSHKLKINCVTERGQLYCSCITYGSVCFSSIFRKKRALSRRADIVLEWALRRYPPNRSTFTVAVLSTVMSAVWQFIWLWCRLPKLCRLFCLRVVLEVLFKTKQISQFLNIRGESLYHL